MREAANDIRRGNSSIRQKLQYLGHKFVSGTEICSGGRILLSGIGVVRI